MKFKRLRIAFSLVCACILLVCSNASAQGQANNWYFGYGAGLNFSTGSPRPLTDGSLYTLEGCASISSENGNLLFYTDGITVYRADHSIMPNGNGLLGDPSSTQSAIIISQPDTPGIYYIFTVDTVTQEGEVNEGVNYTVVDFNQDPEGVVTQKNVNLLAYGAEKLSAVIKSCTDNSVWIVMLSSSNGNQGLLDTFYAYELSRNGLRTTPVRSAAGFSVEDPRGNLKFSPDGTQLACANSAEGLYLADFNSLTGRVSNSRRLVIDGFNYAPYGVEFSPNNRFLYCHSSNNESAREPASSHFSSLIQYDTQAADISASQVLLDQQNLYRGSLQLAPDGKIYRTLSRGYQEGSTYLGVIDAPNEAGTAAIYRDRAIFLDTGISHQGLPPFNQSLFNELDIIQNDLSSRQLALCDGDVYTLQYEPVMGATYSWFRNDNELRSANDYRLTIRQPAGVSLPYTETYRFVLDLNDGSCKKVGIAEVTYYPYQRAVPNVRLVQCEDSETADGFSIFNLDQANDQLTDGLDGFDVTYHYTQSDATNDRNPIDPFGYENRTPTEVLWARIFSPAGCATVNSLTLEVSSTQASSALIEQCDLDDTGFAEFDLSLADDQVLGTSSGTLDVNYYLSERGALLEDEDELLPVIYTNSVAYEQEVFARVENNNACFAISPVNLRVLARPQFSLPQSQFYCATNFPALQTFSPDYSELDSSQNYSYEWMPEGQTTPELSTNLTGEHTLRVTNLATGCFREESFLIEEKELATIDNIEVTDATENNIAIISFSGNGEYELALDDPLGPYQEDGTFEGLQPGFHTVYIRSKEGCGIVEQEFSIIGFPKFFTPNGDGYHDYWNVKGISDLVQPGTSVRVFNRYGKLIKELDPTSSGWDGTFGGENLPADDYWFRILLEDGREFKSHFTLKR
ncbi:MAG: hypothetical protein COA80_16700 [Leeuwenhoekiella sp.]|nr:MAG: hypothetical protein COA80_16700 [Leeuwenhoekiella sp.]